MRNYEQMAEDVLGRRDEFVVRQKRNRCIGGTVVVVGAVCVAMVLAIRSVQVGEMKPSEQVLQESSAAAQTVSKTEPVESETTLTTEPTGVTSETVAVEKGITLIAYNAEVAKVELKENVVLPLCYYIGVTDTRELKSDEIEVLMRQLSDDMEAFSNRIRADDSVEISEVKGIHHRRTLRRENYVISMLRCGSIQVLFDDIDAVETVNVKTGTRYSEVTVYQALTANYADRLRGFDVTVNVDEFMSSEHEDVVFIDWSYSVYMLEELESNPTVSLSNYSDTIVITVNYRDGIQESLCIDMIYNEDGSVSAVLMGMQDRC